MSRVVFLIFRVVTAICEALISADAGLEELDVSNNSISGEIRIFTDNFERFKSRRKGNGAIYAVK